MITRALFVSALALSTPTAAAAAPACNVTLKGANVWTGTAFEKRDLSLADGRFGPAAAGTPIVDASALFIAPPFVDAHTHTIDEPQGPVDKAHGAALAKGVFYALNPNNIRTSGATPAPTATQVDLQAAGGGITKPGGHPRPLYEFLAGRGWLGPLKVADLPGRAFHEATTADQARVAVGRVKANGADVVKLYLLNHDTAKSGGLSGDAFDAAAAEAKRVGLRAIVHVESAADFRRAVAGGVVGIVHLPYAVPTTALPESNYLLTATDAAAAKRAGIVVVPTLSTTLASNDGQRLARAQAVQRANLILLRDAGVPLAIGADNYASGMHDELGVLRQTALFEGAEIMRMATENGARLAFGARKVGRLDAGYEASLIAWFQNPVGDWGVLAAPVLGLRRGEVLIDQAGLLARTCLVGKPTS